MLAGATYVEFDVRTTADGVPVVIHDRTVDRTTDGTGHVWDLTVDEMRELDAGSWFSPAYAGVRVPSLAEVLDLLPDVAPPCCWRSSRRPPSSEVKDDRRPWSPSVGLLDRTVVQSFDPEVIRLVREAAPDVRRGLLRLRFEADTVPLATELDVVCCNPTVADVLGDPETVAELIGAGHRRDAVDRERHRPSGRRWSRPAWPA